MQVRITQNPMPAEMAAQLGAEEAGQVEELGARADTFTLIYGDGPKLQGYAIFGPQDEAGFFVVYMARSFLAGLAALTLRGFFGASAVAYGRPLRVHTSKLQAMARIMGADLAEMALDGDGVPMGVFGNGK